MNICFICKYPPIQGGVSMQCYWAARGLAEKGHKVFVITNANEVEDTFRVHLSDADKTKGGEYARIYPESSGEVKVFSTESPDRSEMYYIPMNNPTVTRLATIATNVIREEKCEVIFAYYFEPYGLAAHLASRWTGVPYIIKHAGSDLNRLMPLEDLQTAYLEVMKAANRIISRGMSRKQILSYGLPEKKITSDVAFGVPTKYFSPDAKPLTLSPLLKESKQNSTGARSQLSFAPLKDNLPVLGIYGKLGEFKGSFDLLYAMSEVIKNGFNFYLIALSRGWQEHRFCSLVEKLGLKEFVRMLPFLPHWKVPNFIHRCTVVAFLERDFPIVAHMPTIPTEIISCGKCLIISEEVARKQIFRAQIRNMKNIIVVPDPKRHDSLASCLRFALEDVSRADEIGTRGLQELTFGDFGDDYDNFIVQLESLLLDVAREEPVDQVSSNKLESVTDIGVTSDTIKQIFPFTFTLMSKAQCKKVIAHITKTSSKFSADDRVLLAIELGNKLLSFLKPENNKKKSVSYEVCRYELKLHEMVEKGRRHGSTESTRSKTPIDFSSVGLEQQVPCIREEVEILDFSYDVEAILTAIESNKTIPRVESKIKILFSPSSPPMKINDATELLLRLIENQITTRKITTTIVNHYQCVNNEEQSEIIKSCASVLEGLYWEGIIEFKS